MLSSKAIIASFFLVSSVLAGLNEDFSHILNGEAPLEEHHIHLLYDKFMQEHQNNLPSSHYPKLQSERKEVFQAKLQEIIEHNKNSENTWKKGLNMYSDMTNEEFNDYFTIVGKPQDCSATHKQRVDKKFQLEEIPTHWDWRLVGGVTPVKNQAKCGSCWTFSTIGCVESHVQIKYNTFRNLSEQQLVDCADNFDNHGCSGGLPSHAFEYFISAGGIALETDYPYTAKDGNCVYKSTMANVKVVGGSVNITTGDEVELQHAIFQYGPVSVCYQVVNGFRDYKEGVYTSDTCKNSEKDVNHAVLAVGFGTQDGMDYWIVKNSWGESFGDAGYFKIQRGVNMCGIAVCNSFPQDVVLVKTSEESQKDQVAEFIQ